MSGYYNADALVSTDWVAEHVGDADVAIVEVDVNTTAYHEGHIPGALGWDWRSQLCDQTRRDVASKDQLEQLLANSGISNDTTVVLYGDNNNWFACWAWWQLAMFGHKKLKLMNGGRKKWLFEERELSTSVPEVSPAHFRAAGPNYATRAYLYHVQQVSLNVVGGTLVDVRSPDEYTGRILAPPGLNETCQRGGHIPGAQNIPWGENCNEDGTFKSFEELRGLYGKQGVTADKHIVTYCRIGERSSLTWFVLKELLGYPYVTNYDGSWTEWGNLVNAPVIRGDQPR